MFTITPTPIGNIQDVSTRVLQVLTNADLIITEDPRITSKLLAQLGIEHKKFLHFGGEDDVVKVAHAVQEYRNSNVAVVVDAGMPGISDPGWVVVNELQRARVPYTVLPGPSALITAVAASGLVSSQFWFAGFLPHKKGRQTLWKRIATSDMPVILYESVHRIQKCLQEIMQYIAPETELFVAREMTKVHEQYWRGKVSDLQDFLLIEKGEFVLVIGAAK